MAKKIIKGKIGNAITSVAEDHIVVVSEDVFDEKHQKYQSEINDIAMSGGYWNNTTKQVLFDRLKSDLAQCINDGTIYFVTDSNGNFTQIALGDGSKSHVVGIGPKMDDATKQELMSKLGLTISSNMGTIQLGKLANHNGVSSQKVVTYERTGLGTDIHEISTVGYVQQYMKTAKAMVYAGVFNAQTKEITDYNTAIISPSEEGNVTLDYLLEGYEGETLLTPGMSFIVGTAGDLQGYTGISIYGGETKVEMGDMIIIINVQTKEGDEGGSTYNEASILIIQNTNLKIADGAITTAKLADESVTASKLSTDIQSLIRNISKTATYAGIATPTTNPGTPDGHVFYLANGKGTYTNFGGINVTEDEVVVLYYDTSWHKEATGIASNDKLTELEKKINGDSASVIIFEDEALSVSAYGNVRIDTRFQNAFEPGTTYIFLASTDTILQFLIGTWQEVARSNGNEVEFQYTSSLQPATQVRIVNKSDVTSLDVFIKSTATKGLVDNINEVKQKIQENTNEINNLTTSFEAQRVQLNTIGTKVEKNTIEVEEVAEIVKGKDHSKVIFEQDLEITKAYGNVLLTDLLSLFKIGNKYSCVVGNGVAQLRYMTDSWVTINRFNEQEFEFEWTDTMATATALQLYSREEAAKTFNLKIVEVGTKTKGLEERVNDFVNEEVGKIKALFPKVEGRSLYLEGASFADFNIGFKGDDSSNPGNGWFELACDRLGLIPVNKARSGSSIVDFARGISDIADSDGHKVNAPWTDEEFEAFDVLCIMHVHNYNVADASVLKTDYDGSEPFLNTPLKSTARVGYICTSLLAQYYAQAFDYVLKEYAKKCYACKDKVGSRWYGTKMGKPFKVICCTHWHDARTIYNDAIRLLQKKWGFELCEFDKHIGFSKNQINPATGGQFSVDYCNNNNADTEVIDEVTYGWHQTRGKNAYIQRQMASIFVDAIKPILCDSDFTK